jgi:hypothetical protein
MQYLYESLRRLNGWLYFVVGVLFIVWLPPNGFLSHNLAVDELMRNQTFRNRHSEMGFWNSHTPCTLTLDFPMRLFSVDFWLAWAVKRVQRNCAVLLMPWVSWARVVAMSTGSKMPMSFCFGKFFYFIFATAIWSFRFLLVANLKSRTLSSMNLESWQTPY